MHNTKPYTERIKKLSQERGVVLTDAQALALLARLASLAKALYQPTKKYRYVRRRK